MANQELVEKVLERGVSPLLWDELQHDWHAFTEDPEKHANVAFLVIEWLEERDNRMPGSEFMKKCTACGGNWAAMVMSGIRDVFPEMYATMPDRDYDFIELCQMLLVKVNWNK
jgi:hypothetical protein